MKKDAACRQIKDLKVHIEVHIYRPSSSNLTDFFEKLELSLNKAFSNYYNVIIMDDTNIPVAMKCYPWSQWLWNVIHHPSGYEMLISLCSI